MADTRKQQTPQAPEQGKPQASGKGVPQQKDMPKARKGTLPRVVKLLMEDYKWPFLLAMLFMTLYSIGLRL